MRGGPLRAKRPSLPPHFPHTHSEEGVPGGPVAEEVLTEQQPPISSLCNWVEVDVEEERVSHLNTTLPPINIIYWSCTGNTAALIFSPLP